jgi:hypothetical protein
MNNQIDIAKHPYGLGGGTIISGSMNIAGEGFWYYPITATVARITLSNLVNSPLSSSFTAGVGVYGAITVVSQSSGIAILYSGSI